MEETAASTPRRLPMWAAVLAFAVLVGFLAMLALGLKRVQAGPILVGDHVPAFTLTTFDKQVFRSDELAGKVIVLNFWASWCKPCEQEAAMLEQAWVNYKARGDVIFLGADYVDTEPEARQYLAKFGVTYPNGPDLRTSISQLFHIRGVPETYFIDKTGRLAAVKIGPFDSLQEISDKIDGLLK